MLKPGDVIVATIHEPVVPTGTLRRVQSIDRSGGALVVTAGDPAGLTDAINTGSVHTRFPLQLETPPAKSAQTLSSVGQFVFPFNDVILFDGDKNLDTTKDQVVMTAT